MPVYSIYGTSVPAYNIYGTSENDTWIWSGVLGPILRMSGKRFNPFQTSFSATRILPSSYLFWAGKRLVDYL
jgi:hypothetical protein